MNILFDTNILIDLLYSRQPYIADAEKLVMKIGHGSIRGFLTANTFTDTYYILRKSMGDTEAREGLYKVMEVFQILSVTGNDCKEALRTSNPDLEDGLLEVCARKSGIDYIVARDSKFIEVCPIAINPANLLKLLN